jgi:hypothetical protein
MAFDRVFVFQRARESGLSLSELARRGGLARRGEAARVKAMLRACKAAAPARRKLPTCPSCGAELQRGMCPVCG